MDTVNTSQQHNTMSSARSAVRSYADLSIKPSRTMRRSGGEHHQEHCIEIGGVHMAYKECLRCGACCRYVVFKNAAQPREKWDQDTLEWMQAHNIFIEGTDLVIMNQCNNLGHSESEWFCRIYKKRPLKCRRFKRGSPECIAARERYNPSPEPSPLQSCRNFGAGL